MSTGHVTITNIKYIPVSSDIEGFGLFGASSAAVNKAKNFHIRILSKDDKFMKVAQEICENRHKGFERGYKRLTNNR